MTVEVVHVEFPSEDVERSQKFWSGLFGWDFKDSEMPGMDYRMTEVGDGLGAAVFESPDKPGHLNYYFDTDDIDASIETVRDLGGHAEERAPVPGHGWFAACTDTEGNAFHLWQTDTAAAPSA